jgi:chorismate mutase/GNAT superfamily N-acetyltransferase
MDVASLTLRPGEPADVDAVTELLVASRRAAVPAMPPPVHSEKETRTWVRWQLEGQREVWVAQAAHGAGPGDEAVGVAILEPAWLHSLYVRPDLTGQGVGSLLLDLVKAQRPDGFSLWVFQSNGAAQRFYRRHGLVEIRRTDGATNEERSPDVEMAWLGDEPVAGLRRQVDRVDAELAELLERRAALSARIQQAKPVPGHAGRDSAREAEIVARMAARAPGLGAERIASIMHAVITASLDAAEDRPGG